MKSNLKKMYSASMVLALAGSVVAGCSSSTTPSSSPTAGTQATKAPEASAVSKPAGLDTSKKVELQFYMLGPAPKDLSVIEEEVNKLALKDLNATVKFNFTTWTDWDQKYKLLLSSGQPIDLIFTADWTQYQSYAKKGAFLPLDELLPKAAPKLNSFVPKDMWDAVKIDGKIYTVPATYKEYVTTGFIWREDLREKFNLPKPDSLANFEAYLDGIKKNMPDMIPLAANSDVKTNLSDLYKNLTIDPVGALPYGIGIPYKNPSEVTSYWGSAEHLKELQTYKKWQDKGYITKNVLNVKDSMTDLIINGKAAANIGDNPSRFNDQKIKIDGTHPDWKLEYYPAPLIKGHAEPVHPIHNGFAIPKSSKNPERALAFYEKMVTDKTYNQLTEYGIEGKNYKVENGYYTMIGDNNSNGFPRESMQGWAWRNPEFMLFDKGYDGVKKIFADLDKISSPDKFTGFAEDYTSYQAEKAALEQVEKQYLYPLEAGLVADVEGGLKTFMEKAKSAGLEKIQAEYKKQWLEYVKVAGIK
ncbi:putative aldouronate transport system substrate-binding protein [Paenibacillus sp. V4I9]|uniref:extracellular solute-binding protein n=1 Tax=Paenibacillus sp. V4I9 TaxID=3042308 RepID=UPI0027817E69|nr:extracellular solute-binding protein [Paenibacillus sp. V4I9]MDQ0890373.1 putative aldouronate transport system substrate-binding protein [Paenibacillus sp. V4I9]